MTPDEAQEHFEREADRDARIAQLEDLVFAFKCAVDDLRKGLTVQPDMVIVHSGDCQRVFNAVQKLKELAS